MAHGQTTWTEVGRTNGNLTGDISSTWNDGSAGVETNWEAIAGTDIDWANVHPDLELTAGEQLPFMQDNTSFYFGNSLDFGIDYDTATEEFQITSGAEKAFGITKNKVVSLATLTDTPSSEENGNLAYVNGKLMVKETT